MILPLKSFSQRILALPLHDKLLALSSIALTVIVMLFFALVPFDAERYASWGYLGVGVANLINSATLFSPVPAFLVTFVAAGVLNPFILILLSTTMVTIGEFVAYIFGEGVEELTFDWRWHDTLKRWFYKSPFIFLVIWIALPNPIQTLGQVFAGTAKYPSWKYGAATFMGNLIWYSLVVFVGYTFLDARI